MTSRSNQGNTKGNIGTQVSAANNVIRGTKHLEGATVQNACANADWGIFL
jgi:hypothetical protein